ncbi:hypothetical protein GDO81_028280 [Engystomops pustulosus]|uniref:Uncharacterized protein n=1 Tax=Engystomops pustulosus TaxID=76066 RepID=A0AAV6YNH5_ENGPU|nr:hypothetical protein GDO81_028280 [Engystomops pustulosus]
MQGDSPVRLHQQIAAEEVSLSAVARTMLGCSFKRWNPVTRSTRPQSPSQLVHQGPTAGFSVGIPQGYSKSKRSHPTG